MTQGPVTLTITVTNKTHLGQTSLAETISKVKNSSVLEILIFFSRTTGCCYSYCYQFCDW